jgi:hypothetical protein
VANLILKRGTNSGHSLPVEFQIYVHGIKTVMGLLERDDALIQKEVKILEGSDDQFGWVEIIVYWCKRILISDYVNTTIESSVRAKVDALCALRKSEDVKFVELRNSFDDGSAIWKRMNADFMSDVDPARSVKDYQELNHVSVNFQTRIKEYALRWSALLSQGVNRSIDEIDALLVDINTFQDSLLEQFNAKSPDVERIQFELQTFINPQDGISQIRELVDREGSMDKSYLLTLEMQLLLEQGKLEPAIELFDTFDDEEITPHSVILIFKAFMQNKAWSSILQLMKHFGTSAKNSPNLAHLQNIGVEILCDQSFLDSAISMDTLTTFLNDSIDFNMLNVRALLSVIRVFQNANQLKDESFEELIVKRLAMNTSLRDVYALWETLPVINLVHLADITLIHS